jgi:hypothetical protein
MKTTRIGLSALTLLGGISCAEENAPTIELSDATLTTGAESLDEPVSLWLPELELRIVRQKVFDRGDIVGLNYIEENGAPLQYLSDREVEDLQRQDNNAYRARVGAIQPRFLETVELAAVEDPTRRLPVMIVGFISLDALPPGPSAEEAESFTPEEDSRVTKDRLIALSRAITPVHDQLTRLTARAGGQNISRSSLMPAIFAEMTGREILMLARETGQISMIFDATAQPLEELGDSVCSIGADVVQSSGINAGDVEVAIVEPNAVAPSACLDVLDQFSNNSIALHPTAVAGIVASTMANAPAGFCPTTGVAPGANILSVDVGTNIFGNIEVGAIDSGMSWAYDKGADVYNLSFGTHSTGEMEGTDLLLDQLVLALRRTATKSAGNIGSTCSMNKPEVTSPGLAYNVITVGNYNDGDNNNNGVCDASDDAISGSSCYGDPNSPHGDREKPEVAAPGTSITTINTCPAGFMCSPFTSSGTSFAAPHVAGAAALLMKRNNAHKWWPELTKAVLMSTAFNNVDGNRTLSEKDGVGGINVAQADIVTAQKDWRTKTLNHLSFNAANQFDAATFTIDGTEDRLKIAMAWSSINMGSCDVFWACTDSVGLSNDLDLIVLRDGVKIASSSRYDNNYETVDLLDPAPGTYTLRVKFYGSPILPVFFGTEYFAIAWGTL